MRMANRYGAVPILSIMSRRLFVFAAPTVAVLMLLVGSPSRAVAATPQLAFSPPSATIAVGSDVNVDISVADVDAQPGLGGYDIALSFDPAVVHLTSLVDSGLVTQGQNIVICNPASIDNAAGTATATCGTLPIFGFPGVSAGAPSPLLHAVFSAQAPGSATLSLAKSVLEDPVGGSLSVTFVPGSITVPGTEAPTATIPAAAVVETPGSSATAGPAAAVSATTGAPTGLGVTGSATTRAGAPSAGSSPRQGTGGRSATGALNLPSSGAGPATPSPSADLRAPLMLLLAAASVLVVGMFRMIRQRRS